MNIIARVNELIVSSRSFCLATIIHSSDSNINPGNKIIVFDNGSFEGGTKHKKLNEAIFKHATQALTQKKKRLIEIKKGTIVFFDVIAESSKLVICGAGHIAIPLAQFTLELGFSVTVIDDRPKFANQSRFENCKVIVGNFTSVIQKLPIDNSTFVVIITRGHEHDVDCLAEILPLKTAYVGLIGSRRRVRFVLELLFKKGIPADRLEDLFTPIGLPIGAESPEEIALSIAAELVCIRRQGSEQARKLRNVIDT
jgi:xanthine dehydrogenase accessory factor